MSLYKAYRTDSSMETSGIVAVYDHQKFLLARAGGANEKFKRTLAAKMKPHRHAIDNETMSEDTAMRIQAEVFAESVVLKAEVLQVVDGKETWVPGLEGPTGEVLPFTKENLVQMFLDLPELFADVRGLSMKAANFRRQQDEADAKN